jgi:hypothetical protein
MKKILFMIVIAAGFSGYSQVGVGTNSPDASAQLDVVSANKGMLIPRVNLTGSTDVATIKSPAVSLLVYNAKPATDVVAGFYYWNGTKWAALAAGGTTSGGSSISMVDVDAAVLVETDRAKSAEAGLFSSLGTKAAAIDVDAAILAENTRATGIEGQLKSGLDNVGNELNTINTELTAKATTAAMDAKVTELNNALGLRDIDIAARELKANKVTVIGLQGDDVSYPTTKAVKDYVTAAQSSSVKYENFKEITATYTLGATDAILFVPSSVSSDIGIDLNDTTPKGQNTAQYGRTIKVISASANNVNFSGKALESSVGVLNVVNGQMTIGVYTPAGWMLGNVLQ